MVEFPALLEDVLHEPHRLLLHAIALQRVVEEVDQVPGAQVRDELVDVSLHPLQIFVDRLVDPEVVHVDPLPGPREAGLDLLTDDDGRLEVGAAGQDVEGAVDGVVVGGDGDIVAADLPAALVDAQGVVVGVARAGASDGGPITRLPLRGRVAAKGGIRSPDKQLQ